MCDQEPTVAPVKKNKRGEAIRSEQKILVIKMYKAKKARDPKILYKQMIKELMAETGIGKTSIQKMISEYNKNKTISSPNMTKVRPKLVEKFDDRDLNAIRRRIHRFWHDREPPTMEKVMRAVTEDDGLPTVKRTSMYRLLKDLNFVFTKRKRNGVVLTERADVVAWRRQYLRSVRSCREDGRPVYYVAETRLGVPEKSGELPSSTEEKLSHRRRSSRRRHGGPAADGGCGRLVAVHIGSRDGFVDGGLMCFGSSGAAENGCAGPADAAANDAAANDATATDAVATDAAAAMDRLRGHVVADGAGFLRWFENVLPLLPDHAVIVTDNTPYNSAKVDTVPVASWKKTNVIKWLLEKDVPVDDTYVRPELFDLVGRHVGPAAADRYVVDEVARAANKTVLRLPPYHRELNAMELAWSAVEGGVRDGDGDGDDDVARTLAEAARAVTADQWRRFDEQTVREECRLWELDRIVDDFLENDDCATCVLTLDTDDSSSCDTDF